MAISHRKHAIKQKTRPPRGEKTAARDLEAQARSWEERRQFGKTLRTSVPREQHAEWSPGANRPDPIEIIQNSNRGRQENLLPLRVGRMAASPFAFLRGSAEAMACDLSGTPVSGVNTGINGDAHLGNFGFFATPQGDVVFDVTDFDEATIGPWEWDLKRLAASVNVAARENKLSRRERQEAVMSSVAGYRWNIENLQDQGALDIWRLHTYAERKSSFVRMGSTAKRILRKAVQKALRQTDCELLPKMAERNEDGSWRFKEDAPVLTRVDSKTRQKVAEGLISYAEVLTPERRFLFSRYALADVGHRVVGVGSVGRRAYLALLFGNGDQDPLILQLKEAAESACAPYVPPVPETLSHHGARVVAGQRIMQPSADLLLGWTTIDNRPFYVRQMRNRKGSIPLEDLDSGDFGLYAWVCGAVLARAHARTGDAPSIAGYCGRSTVLDEALAQWAELYGDQTESDHNALVKAVKQGRLKAVLGV